MRRRKISGSYKIEKEDKVFPLEKESVIILDCSVRRPCCFLYCKTDVCVIMKRELSCFICKRNKFLFFNDSVTYLYCGRKVLYYFKRKRNVTDGNFVNVTQLYLFFSVILIPIKVRTSHSLYVFYNTQRSY